MSVYVLLCFFFSFGLSLKIAVLPTSASSHEFVAFEISVEAARRGHNVSVFLRPSIISSNPRYENPPLGVSVIPFPMASFSDAELLEFFDSLAEMEATKTMHECLKMLDVTGTELFHLALPTLREADVITGCSMIVYPLRYRDDEFARKTIVSYTPVGLIHPFHVYPLGIDFEFGLLPFQGSRLPHIKSFRDRLLNTILGLVHYFYVLPTFSPAIMEFYRKVAPNHQHTAWKKLRVPCLILNSWALEIPRNLPPSVFLTGLVLPRPAKPLPEDLAAWLKRDPARPVIFVSLGTTSKVIGRDKELLFALFEAVQDVRFIWKINNMTFADEQRLKRLPHVLNASWLPQNDLLSHVQVFISHCGMNSLQEALYHGVPILGVPRFGDQYENAATAERLNSGIALDLMTVTPDELVRSLRHMLNTQSFASSAKRVSRVLQNEPSGATRTIDIIEQLHATGSDHLFSSQDLPFWKRYCLDSFAILIALIVLPPSLLLRCCVKRCCHKKQKTH